MKGLGLAVMLVGATSMSAYADVLLLEAIERGPRGWRAWAMGWVAGVGVGALYHMITRVWHTEMWSVKLVNTHFWLLTIGTVVYIVAMWVSGIMQGLMWRAVNTDGTLTYSFIESVERSYPFYYVRLLGGALFLLGMFFMAYNTWKTAASGSAQEADDAIPATAAH